MEGKMHKTLLQLKALTKYGMTMLCMVMTAHCGFLWAGYDAFIVHLTFCIFVMIIGIKLSSIFNMCKIHKASVIYTMSVIMCVVLRRHGIFTVLHIDLNIARAIMFFIGLIIVTLNIWKMKDKSC